MQETLTDQKILYSKFKIENRKKSKLIKIYTLITIMIMIFISIIIVNKNYNYNYNKSQNFYLLSLNNALTKSKAEQLKETIDQAVDVSYVYYKGGVYYIVGFVYNNQLDADNVLKSLKEMFPSAEVIIEESVKIKPKVYNKIKSDSRFLKIYKGLCDLKSQFFNLCEKVEDGLDLFSLYRELTKIELSLDLNFSYLQGLEEDSIVKEIKLSHSVVLSFIRKAKDNISVDGDLLENVKVLYLKTFFEELSLKKSLNHL